MDTAFTICADCASRLRNAHVPEAPEMLDGQCPQCGSTRSRVVYQACAFMEFPPDAPTTPIPQPTATPPIDTGRRAA